MALRSAKTSPVVSWAMATPNRPIATPPVSASVSPARPPLSSATRETRITAATASTMPMMTIGGGMPSITKPARTGITAASTPVTGATIPIRPIARPRYSIVMPNAPRMPATRHTSRSLPVGNDSPRRSASATHRTRPVACETSTTP